MNMKEFGLYLASAREKSGYLSQRQLAVKSGVSNGTIARIEGGTQKATPETLAKLASCLRDTTYEDLMEAAGYIDSSGKSDDVTDEEALKLINDPDFMVAYKKMPGTPEETRQDLIDFMKMVIRQEKRKKNK